MARSKIFRPAVWLALAVILLVVSGCKKNSPVIVGISSCWEDGRVSLSDAYLFAVRAAGGVPVVLPPVQTAEDAAAALASVDALILSGGEDIEPYRYGEEVLNATVEVNGARDTSDFLLASEALRRGMPILGICRGEQLLNVVLGGSLYQDLPTCIGKSAFIRGSVPPSAGHAEACFEPICHRQKAADGVPTHMIYIEADSRLRELLGADSLMVNSFHHQAVKEPGAGVRVVARAADGVVEAWEYDGPNISILCVQFHPELLYARGGDTTFLPIFQDLIHRAASN